MVEKISNFQNISPCHTAPANKKGKSTSVQNKDTLSSSGQQETWLERFAALFGDSKHIVYKVAIAIWKWVKYEVFFFIFDKENDLTLKYETELEQYLDAFYEADSAVPQSQQLLRDKFKNLSPCLQTEIRKVLAYLISKSNSTETVDSILKKNLWASADVSLEYENGDGSVDKMKDKGLVLFAYAVAKVRDNPLGNDD